MHRNQVNPRYELRDKATGLLHTVTYGDPILASVSSNIRQFAMDAMPRDNGNLLHGGYGSTNTEPDPMMTKHRNGPDQANFNAQELLDFVQLCLRGLSGDEKTTFLQGLDDRLTASRTAGDQYVYEPGSRDRPIRLPAGGLGTNVSEMTAAKDWNGRPGQASSPAMMSRRRPAQDVALTSARRQREESDFAARWPDAARIRFGANAY